jgi:hypothetical protein
LFHPPGTQIFLAGFRGTALDLMGALMDGVSSDGAFVSVVGVVAQALIPNIIANMMMKNRFRISDPFSLRFYWCSDFIA